MEGGSDPAAPGLMSRGRAHGAGTGDRRHHQYQKSRDDENQADAGYADHGNHLLSNETQLPPGFDAGNRGYYGTQKIRL
jgi:hypothetical protein